MTKHNFILGGMAFALAFVVSFSGTTYACDTDDTDTSDDEITEDVIYSDEIYITELLPNPSGEESSDEFIELYNASNNTVDLSGWQISDATTKQYTLSGSVGSGQYYVVYRTESGIALNNTGDSVELYQPNDELLDIVEYTESVADDIAYALGDDDEWHWTTTGTPGRQNSITELDDGSNINDDTSDGSSEDSADNNEKEQEQEQEENDLQGYDFSDEIILSELLPDPEGSDATDEWIELHNTGSKTIDLYGWQLADPSKTYTIDESLQIAGGDYLTFSVVDTGISLNNSGDTIYIYDPAGDVMDEVTYDSSDSGQAYAFVNDGWQWSSTPTPDEANVISATAETAELSDDNETNGVTTRSNNIEGDTEYTGIISIAAAKQLPKGESAIITGTVNVLPDVFGSQFFYIQDETSGIQVYSSKQYFPDLAVGDLVQVSGKMSEASGEKKINISVVEDIEIISTENELRPIEISEYAESQLGQLVQVGGEVTEKSGSTIILDTGWNIYVKRATGLSTKAFEEGEHVTVVGVLTATNDGVRVLPRGEQDVSNLTASGSSDNKSAASSRDLLVKSAHAQSGDSTNLDIANEENKQLALSTTIWIGIIVVVISLLLALSRSEKISSLVRNRCARWVRALAARLNRWAGLERSAKDSTDRIPRHAQLPLEKTRS